MLESRRPFDEGCVSVLELLQEAPAIKRDQEGVIIYTPGNGGRFHKQGRAEHRVPYGVPARVRPINENTLKLMQLGRRFNKLWSEGEEDKPEFMDFLQAWGGEWMWKEVQLNETPEWAAECLRTGDLVCVTNGAHTTRRQRRIYAVQDGCWLLSRPGGTLPAH